MSRYYSALCIQTLKEAAAYRLNFILSFLVVLIPLAGQLLLARFVYSGGYQIGNWDLDQLLLYFVVATIASELFVIGTWWDIQNDIEMGSLNYHLLKPYSYYWHNFVVYYALKAVYTLFAVMVAYIAFVAVSGSFVPQIDLKSLIQFIVMALVATHLSFLITYYLSLLTFFFTDIGFVMNFLGIILPFASGNILPLDIFPGLIKVILMKLPSAYLVYHPSRILTGSYAWTYFWQLVLEALLWLLFFVLITLGAWSRGRKKYEAIG